MKKILLGLTTLGVIALPIATVISCGSAKSPTTNQGPSTNQGPTTNKGPTHVIAGVPWTLQTKAVTTKPAVPDSTKTPTTPGPVQAVVKNPGPFINNYKTTDAEVTNFTITTASENPIVKGYLSDVTSAPREFRIYDNGLFKIKIQTSLIGTGKYYADNSKADLQASDVAKSISIGPAILDLPKGIQILESNAPASLGGINGVQVSLSNRNGSPDDAGILNTTALVTHEYGHHETLWDFRNMMGGSLDDVSTDGKTTLSEAMSQGLTKAGYDSISKLILSSDPAKRDILHFVPAVDGDFPTDYGKVQVVPHTIFDNPDYPFDAAEVATRMLNMLSFRTTLSAQDLYKQGASGKYPVVGGKMRVFEPPACFVSDATMRHYAKDSTFGTGKDNSRIDALIKFYEDDIFGLNKGSITAYGNLNGGGEITELHINDFGTIPNLDSIEILKNDTVVASSNVSSFNSRIGFKSELVSSTWDSVLSKRVTEVSGFTFDFKGIKNDYYKVVGKDSSGNPVDISSLAVNSMESSDKTRVYPSIHALAPEGDHFYINMQ